MTVPRTSEDPSPTSPTPVRGDVVVGFDNTPAGTAALRWAASWADHHRLPLHVVHVHERLSDPARFLETNADDALRRSRQRIFALVCERLADVTTEDGGRVSVSVVPGRVIPELADAARQSALLVVGEPTSPEHVHLAEELSSLSACEVAVVAEGGTSRLLSPGARVT